MYMNSANKTQSNNEKLRELIDATGLTQVEALALFNAGLDVAGYSIETWRAYFCNPTTARYRPFPEKLLARAERIFGKIKRNR